MPAGIAVEYIRRLRAAGVIIDADHAEVAAHDLGAPPAPIDRAADVSLNCLRFR
jgi:hypothetical protein